MVTVRVVLSICLMCSAVLAQNDSQSNATTSGGKSSTVTILIRASDKRGNPVALSKSALMAYADGQQVQIEDLKSARDAPLRFVLLLDLSRSDIDKLKFEKKAAQQIFADLSNGGNEGYFGWFNQQASVSSRPMKLSEVSQFLANANAGGATALYDAVVQACDLLSHGAAAPSVRRLLIVITDGEDNQSHFSVADAAKFAERAGVPIFALGLLSSSPRPTGGSVLRKLAQETGGYAVVLDSPGDFLDKLLRPLDTQYFLTFAMSPVPQSKTNQLEIKTMEHGAKLFVPFAYPSN